MFTGVIEVLGRVTACSKKTAGASLKLEIETPKAFSDRRVGSSVAVQGVCLTVVGRKGRRISFQVVRETLRRSTLGQLKPGDRVHLERPLRHGERLEGHFVQGHVDGVGVVQKVLGSKSEKSFLIRYPRKLKRHLAEKGSIAVDGVSLTLGKVLPSGFWIHCVPHTLKLTRFSSLSVGDRVNLETDLLSKFSRTKKTLPSTPGRMCLTQVPGPSAK